MYLRRFLTLLQNNMDRYTVNTPKNYNREKLINVRVPGSKSITNRALLLAALSDGECHLTGCQFSDDSLHFLDCLKKLGFSVVTDEINLTVTITGNGGSVKAEEALINVGSAGTAARFIVAMLGLTSGTFTVESSEQMKKRPMEPLITALRNAGAKITCLEEENHFPLTICGVSDPESIPDVIKVNIDKSSQFLSALLIAAAAIKKAIDVEVTGSHGLAYVDMTVAMAKDFGVEIKKEEQGDKIVYHVPGDTVLKACDYKIEPDVSAAAYFYGAAALLGNPFVVEGVKRKSLQGDIQILDVLKKMGCSITEDETQVMVSGPASYQLKGGFEIDMSTFSDQALTVAVLSAYADAPVLITGIGHIRLQESDRIAAIVENLENLGVKTESGKDFVKILPDESKMHGGKIKTFDDHRVAMSFSMAGLRTEGVEILDPLCCRKTFKEYFTVFDNVLGKIRG